MRSLNSRRPRTIPTFHFSKRQRLISDYLCKRLGLLLQHRAALGMLGANSTVKTRPVNDQDSDLDETVATDRGPTSAGQAGDTQGLSDTEGMSSESVTELLEEGQYFEASVISGIENAPPADVAEVKTREVLEDDVPGEYIEDDEPPK